MNNDLSESKILELLRNHVCEVSFKKVDGTLRVMPCTLLPSQLPVVLTSKIVTEGETKTRAPVPGVISAWCVDRQAWRSFRIDNVISVIVMDNIAE